MHGEESDVILIQKHYFADRYHIRETATSFIRNVSGLETENVEGTLGKKKKKNDTSNRLLCLTSCQQHWKP